MVLFTHPVETNEVSGVGNGIVYRFDVCRIIGGTHTAIRSHSSD